MDYHLPVLNPIEIEPIVIQKPAEPSPPETVLYKIVYGDNLTTIAEAHNVPLERLWAANPELTDPDLITPDTPLKIPQEGDILPDRPLPSNIVETSVSSPPSSARNSSPRGSFSSSGNTYTPGQCTWGVKNWRPDIPNGWGSASAWLRNARGQGWATGSTPRTGAVAWTSGHVALVVGVNGDKVLIKEMNYNWTPYSVRTIEKPASKYMYIY